MCPPAPRSSTLTVGSAGFAPCIGAAIAPPASATAAKAARSLRLLFIVVFLSVGASPFLRLHPVRNTHPPFLTTQFRHLVLVDSTVCFMAIVAPPDSEACATLRPSVRRSSASRPDKLRARGGVSAACVILPQGSHRDERWSERSGEAGEPTGAREHVCGPGVILTASVKGAREGARVKIMPVGCPQTAGRASRSGEGLTIGRRGDSEKPKHAPPRTRHRLADKKIDRGRCAAAGFSSVVTAVSRPSGGPCLP